MDDHHLSLTQQLHGLEKKQCRNDCKWTQWTGLAPCGTLSYLSRCHKINLSLNQYKHKGHKFHLRQWLRGKGGKEPDYLYLCAFVWWKFPWLLLLSIPSADREREGFKDKKWMKWMRAHMVKTTQPRAQWNSTVSPSTPQLISSVLALIAPMWTLDLIYLHLDFGWIYAKIPGLTDSLGETFSP